MSCSSGNRSTARGGASLWRVSITDRHADCCRPRQGPGAGERKRCPQAVRGGRGSDCLVLRVCKATA